MRKVKKMIALVIAMAMVLGMYTMVFADENDGGEGGGTSSAAGNNSITVDVNFKGQTYTLYKLFDATVNDARAAAEDSGSASSVTTAGISYTLIDETNHALTKEFTVTKADGTTANVKGADWFEFVNASNHNIQVKSGADISEETFRLWAAAYGVQTGNALTAASDNDANIAWTGLADGYYFITTTTGSLVTVDSVAPNAVVKDKNSVPTVDKTVTGGTVAGGDSAAENAEVNTASVGDVLTYRATIHAKAGAKKYVFTDTMNQGLSLVNYTEADASADPAVQEVKLLVQAGAAQLTAGTDYTIDTFTAGKGGTFTVSFRQTYLDTISANTDIVITYKAMVNEEAVIAGNGNVNTGTLQYGDNHTTMTDTTTTYVYRFQIVKDDDQDKILTGAKFKLYDAQTGGNEIAVVKTEEGKYRVALSGETGVEIEAGTPEISGLSNGTYWVEETHAPDGYNMLTGRTYVTLTDADNMAVFTDHAAVGTEGEDGYTAAYRTYVSGGLEVENQAGSVLPSTGGIGTAIFYVAGSILVIGVSIVMITRRVMNSQTLR